MHDGRRTGIHGTSGQSHRKEAANRSLSRVITGTRARTQRTSQPHCNGIQTQKSTGRAPRARESHWGYASCWLVGKVYWSGESGNGSFPASFVKP